MMQALSYIHVEKRTPRSAVVMEVTFEPIFVFSIKLFVSGLRNVFIYCSRWDNRSDTVCELPDLDLLWSGDGCLAGFEEDEKRYL